MGRLIDADKFIKDVERDRKHEIYLHSWTADMVLKRLDSWYAPTVEAIPKDQYEARLKADKVAMLKELQSEVEGLRAKKHFQYKHGQEHGLNDASELIQKHIDAL